MRGKDDKKLKEACRKGIPDQFRRKVWKILAGVAKFK